MPPLETELTVLAGRRVLVDAKKRRVTVLFAEKGRERSLRERIALCRQKIDDAMNGFPWKLSFLSPQASQNFLHRRTGQLV